MSDHQMRFCEFTGDGVHDWDEAGHKKKCPNIGIMDTCMLHKMPLGEHEGWRVCCSQCRTPVQVKPEEHMEEIDVSSHRIKGARCNICKRELTDDPKSDRYDCGGDCARCMADSGDPDQLWVAYEGVKRDLKVAQRRIAEFEDANVYREYVQVGGVVYCLHGSSSISAFRAVEEERSRYLRALEGQVK